jgi:hypothetical protein
MPVLFSPDEDGLASLVRCIPAHRFATGRWSEVRRIQPEARCCVLLLPWLNGVKRWHT